MLNIMTNTVWVYRISTEAETARLHWVSDGAITIDQPTDSTHCHEYSLQNVLGVRTLRDLLSTQMDTANAVWWR